MIKKIKIKNILLVMMLIATIVGSCVEIMSGEKAYADISAPMVFSYDVRVVNEDGIVVETADSLKKKIIVPYQAIITIYNDSSEFDGRMVYGKYNETGIWLKFDENVGYASDTFDLSKVEPKDEITRYVFADGVELYNGPNKRYGRVSDNYVLPVGVTIKSVYYDDLWMYVEYDGHVGWIYYDTLYALLPSGSRKNDIKVATPASEERNSFITAVSNIVLTDTYGENGKQIDSFMVDEFTELPFLYSISSKNIFWVYVSYQGHEGWVDASMFRGVAVIKIGEGPWWNTITGDGIVIKEATMFETSSLSSDIGKTIPVNEEITIKYGRGDGENLIGMYYVEYDGVAGWVGSDFILATKSFSYTLNAEMPVYDAIDGNVTGVIGAGTYKAKCSYSILDNETFIGNWYYLTKDDGEKVGWIKVIYTEDERIEEERKRQEMEEKEDDIKIEILDNDENMHRNERIEREQTIKNTMLLLIVCFGFVSCAIVLALTLKKKKDEESDKKDEEKDSIDEEKDEEKKSEVIEERDESSVSPKEELRELEEKEDGDE